MGIICVGLTLLAIEESEGFNTREVSITEMEGATWPVPEIVPQ